MLLDCVRRNEQFRGDPPRRQAAPGQRRDAFLSGRQTVGTQEERAQLARRRRLQHDRDLRAERTVEPVRVDGQPTTGRGSHLNPRGRGELIGDARSAATAACTDTGRPVNADHGSVSSSPSHACAAAVAETTSRSSDRTSIPGPASRSTPAAPRSRATARRSPSPQVRDEATQHPTSRSPNPVGPSARCRHTTPRRSLPVVSAARSSSPSPSGAMISAYRALADLVPARTQVEGLHVVRGGGQRGEGVHVGADELVVQEAQRLGAERGVSGHPRHQDGRRVHRGHECGVDVEGAAQAGGDLLAQLVRAQAGITAPDQSGEFPFGGARRPGRHGRDCTPGAACSTPRHGSGTRPSWRSMPSSSRRPQRSTMRPFPTRQA